MKREENFGSGEPCPYPKCFENSLLWQWGTLPVPRLLLQRLGGNCQRLILCQGARGPGQAVPISQSQAERRKAKEEEEEEAKGRPRTKGAPDRPGRRRATRATRAQHRPMSTEILPQYNSPNAIQCHGSARCAVAVGNPASTPCASDNNVRTNCCTQ